MEARNFQTAKEMVEDNNWLLPTLNGEPRYQKPPLPTWLTAFSVLLFNSKSIIFYRIPAILLLFIIGITSYFFSLKIKFNRNESIINGLITLSSIYIIAIVFEAPWDIFAHGFMFLAIYFLFSSLENKFNLDPDQFKVTGLAVLYNNMLQSLFSSQIKSLGLVFGAIGFMLLILFRSIKITLIALAPNIITAGSVLGMLGILGIPLDMMTITVAAISVGMAVDNTIHYLFRYKTETQKNEVSMDNRIINSHASVGRAVFYTATTIAAGFSIFAFSNFTPTVLFGVFTAFALMVSFFASLTLLPFLLNLFNPFKQQET